MKIIFKVILGVLTFLFSIVSAPCLLQAQTPGYYYSYDEAGNRTGREFTPVFIRKGSEEETIQKLKDCTVKVLPNPTKGWLELTLTDLPKDSKTSVIVYNLEGKPMIEQSNFGEFLRIDLSEKPNGTYIMRIVIDGKALDYKIIKQE